jgi:hypothetical protein
MGCLVLQRQLENAVDVWHGYRNGIAHVKELAYPTGRFRADFGVGHLLWPAWRPAIAVAASRHHADTICT